jgi:pimeloyl-ACP methyl ester carboxylesterase
MQVLERTIGFTSRVAPGLGAAVAEELWFRPMGRPAGPLPEDAEKFALTVNRRHVTGFTIGNGPVALLLHGWGGAGSDMSAAATALAGAGFRSVVIDLPGHGPDRRSRTDLFVMSAAINAVSGMFGSPDVVVAHSFGAAAAFTAFVHGGPRQVVLIAPAIRSERFVDYFSGRLTLSSQAKDKLWHRLERFAGPQILSIMRGDAEIPGAEVLILHDPEDPRTPFEDSAAYSEDREQVSIVSVPGSGHRDILANESVLSGMIDFVTENKPAAKVLVTR